MKKINLKYIHILIIILGILFITIPAFHTNLWFDESYSVAIASNHTFQEIWEITGHDVHPPFYYWILKVISLIFGNHILYFRLLSVISLAILGILGYTHIRKDFGEKVGAVFSLFVFVFPANLVYASEIRMYTWGMLFVVIMAIYAYRIYKENNSNKNWLIFSIFSLISAYTHYYGLMTAGVINFMLFIWCIRNSIKQRNITIQLKKFLVQAVIQIILYIPWVIFLLLQMSQVSKGFWIDFQFPKTIIEIFNFQFTGNLGGTRYINNWIAGIYGIILCGYLLYVICKNRQKNLMPSKMAIIVYVLVILGAAIVSVVMSRPILYARYFLIITGILIFAISYIITKIGNKLGNITIIILTVIISTCINISLIQINYDKSNQEPINYIRENAKEGDIFIYNFSGGGFVATVNFPQYKMYFYDSEQWNVEEAYKAYAPNMQIIYNLDILDDYSGRVWFIGTNDYELFENARKQYDGMNLIKQDKFSVKYQLYQYSYCLVEKQ